MKIELNVTHKELALLKKLVTKEAKKNSNPDLKELLEYLNAK